MSEYCLGCGLPHGGPRGADCVKRGRSGIGADGGGESVGGVPMPDISGLVSLRDRIAAALYGQTMSRLLWYRSWQDLHPDTQQIWLDDADAVIKAIDLGIPCATTGCRMRHLARGRDR